MSRVTEPLSVGRIVGEVVDNFTPSVNMNVFYNKHVSNGFEFMPSAVISKPRVEIGGVDLREAYTLVSLFPLPILKKKKKKTLNLPFFLFFF